MEWRNQRAGFTLIEVAVVLVIIGLIVGGILVGRDLVSSAKVRAQLSQLEKYTQAANTFRQKYNCLPGDCMEAASLGLYDAVTGLGDKGNGDGFITQYVNGTQAVSTEWVNFWYHLQVAKLIDFSVVGNMPSGAYTQAAVMATTPQGKLDGTYVIATGFNDIGNGAAANSWITGGGNGYFIGIPSTQAGQAIFNSPALTPLKPMQSIPKLIMACPIQGMSSAQRNR